MMRPPEVRRGCDCGFAAILNWIVFLTDRTCTTPQELDVLLQRGLFATIGNRLISGHLQFEQVEYVSSDTTLTAVTNAARKRRLQAVVEAIDWGARADSLMFNELISHFETGLTAGNRPNPKIDPDAYLKGGDEETPGGGEGV
jgi:hypothetical protein